VGSGVGTRGSRVILLGAVVLLGILVIGGVLAAGPVRTGAAPWGPPLVEPAQITQPPVPHASQPSATPSAVSGAVSSALPKTLIVLAVLGALALAYVLWRALRRRATRPAPLPPHLGLQQADAPATDRDPEPDPAPAVSRGIARALEVLDEPRQPHDAIVAAWLGLQEAAADSGVRRRDAETPGEYTARLIGRIGADRTAAQTLLRLYQDVRFGDHPVDVRDVDAARTCLLRLRESWRSAEAGSR
jgi:hypothetical protein